MIVTFDIETLPCNDQEVVAEFSKDIQAKVNEKVAAVKAPSNYKDEAKIAEYVEAKKNEIYGEATDMLEEAISKTSFSGLYGRIACICYAIDDGEVHALAFDEKTIIEQFYERIYDAANTYLPDGRVASEIITFCGHNVVGFDLPFLKHRSIILGVLPPPSFLKAFSAKPWGTEVADTMLMWSTDPHKRGSMDRLCKAFGIPGKGDFDGSMVAATWPVDPEKVIDYCKDDVRRTRQMYKRITFQV